MELLEDPEIKSTYEKCKYMVKLWEHKFKKKNGRIPSKLDIKDSSREVRQAYKTYFHLKSAVLEQSLRDIDDFNFDDGTYENNNISSGLINERDSLSTTESSKDITKSSDDSFNVASKSENNENANFASTWGSHLNNPKGTDKNVQDSNPTPDINNTLSQKLFCGSKFASRNPRKSKSFSKKKSEINIPLTSFSQPATHDEIKEPEFQNSESILNLDSPILRTNCKIEQALLDVKSSTVNIVQNICGNVVRARSNLNSGWISRMSLENSLERQNCINVNDFPLTSQLESDDDDIIEDSDEEKSKLCKRPRLSAYGSNCSHAEDKRLDFSNLFPNKNNSFQTISSYSNNTKNDIEIENKTPTEKWPNLESPSSELKTPSSSVQKSPRKHPIVQDSQIELKGVNNNNLRKSTRTSKKIIKGLEQEIFDTENEDPFANDSDLDPDFELKTKSGNSKLNRSKEKCEELNKFSIADSITESKNSKLRVSKKTRTRKDGEQISSTNRKTRNAASKVKSINDPHKDKTEDDENSEYVLEYSVTPRIKTIPRNMNLKNVISNAKKKVKASIQDAEENIEKDGLPLIKDKRTIAKEKLEKKIASGKLNDNFVTINIKKKVFVRGKKSMNFSKFKKNAWKKKKSMATSGPDMDMRGCDGGMLTCFKCGQVGHFAQSCKTQIGDSLLPLSVMETDEPCPFPTLEEAAKIAEEQNKELNVRKSSRTFDSCNQKIIINEDAAKDKGIIESTEEVENDDSENPFNDSDDDLLLAETLNIEKHLSLLDVQKYVDKSDEISAVYEPNEDGSLIDTPKEVFDALHLFGYESFRPGQESAVMRILSGKSTLVTLSTGSGKSLCYQLPAYLYSKKNCQRCISLVISPLVSLMEDQVTGIPVFLKAACLHTNKTRIQRDQILEEVRDGNLDILLVSPEAIVAGEKSTGFGSLLRHLPPIAFACIDEAHCLSQWSHNFRPSYLMLSRILRERLGVNTILGLTATATLATSASIVSHLGIQDGNQGGVIKDRPLPDNIQLTVSRDVDRDRALLSLVLSEEFKSCTSIIVYCTRREECERIASYLRTCLANITKMKDKNEDAVEITKKRKRRRENIHAEPYHAGLAASRRRTIQRSFMFGELRIVVATVAFGMGINKADIRSVIHYNMPKTFESYVQEVGRAGRDGLPAHCHLFMDPRGQDMDELQRHIHANSIDRHVIRKLLRKIFIPCSCKPGKCPKHEVAFAIQETVFALDVPEENIATLLCYLELHDKRYIEVLSLAYTQCKIISYGGPNHISKAAKDCPPLAMGLALYPPNMKNGNSQISGNIAEFPVIEIAAAIGWDSGICKHKLKNLEWISEQGQPKRSPLSVQFSQLGFRLLAPGNLTGDELDTALDSLYSRVTSQEQTAVSQLNAVHTALSEAAEPNFKNCLISKELKGNKILKKEEILKESVREYFEGGEHCHERCPFTPLHNSISDPDRIASDARALVCMYRDNSFTGRSVARIFHGIQSPNYPAVIWGRCKFWRTHLSEDFNEICKIATSEILKMR